MFLALYQYFDGTFFHRVIPGFVVQGGDPTGTGTGGAVANGTSGLKKYGYPGYSFTGNTPPASCKTKPTQAGLLPALRPRARQPRHRVQPTAASSSSCFPAARLPSTPVYTIFGKVVSGMSVVEKIGSLRGTPYL